MPETDDTKPEVATKDADAAREALEQAQAYDSVFSATVLKLDGGGTVTIPPAPMWRLLDDDRLEAYDELLFELQSYDREPDIFYPEQKVKDSAGNEIIQPSQTRKGATMVPHCKDGKLIKPPWEIRLVETVLGTKEFAKLRAGKIDGKQGSARMVRDMWNRQAAGIKEREAVDPKSVGSTVDGAPVPEADTA